MMHGCNYGTRARGIWQPFGTPHCVRVRLPSMPGIQIFTPKHHSLLQPTHGGIVNIPIVFVCALGFELDIAGPAGGGGVWVRGGEWCCATALARDGAGSLRWHCSCADNVIGALCTSCGPPLCPPVDLITDAIPLQRPYDHCTTGRRPRGT